MWDDFFKAGGWGMYPTMIFGFFFVAASVLFLLRPERRFLPLVASLGAVTLGSGLLGTSVGIVKSFHYLQQVPAADQLIVATLGCAESLNNLVLALIIVVAATLLVSIGALRLSRAAAASST